MAEQGYERWLVDMAKSAQRTHWTRHMLQWLKKYAKENTSLYEVTRLLNIRFPTKYLMLDEVDAELQHLKKESYPNRGIMYPPGCLVVQEITKDVMKLPGNPVSWQETYRYIQKLKLDGLLD
ncbi:MAG: hypothetical protein Q9226_002350 [Calogaya cf. arnoldii]